MEVLGIPASFGVLFGLMAFTTFVYDTLDVCTRLGRYILQELFGWQGNLGRYFATALTAFIPLIFVLQTTTDAAGNVIPGWRVFWPLFGASNQLLAAIGLLGITVWLHRTYRAKWVWPIAGIPTIIMYVMSGWRSYNMFPEDLLHPMASRCPRTSSHGLRSFVLAVLLLWEAVKVFSRSKATAVAAGNPPAVAG
ncbi:MAG: hypothetical protein IPK53_17685 [bacterium]|nr:hypothetical protein [bacterium]